MEDNFQDKWSAAIEFNHRYYPHGFSISSCNRLLFARKESDLFERHFFPEEIILTFPKNEETLKLNLADIEEIVCKYLDKEGEVKTLNRFNLARKQKRTLKQFYVFKDKTHSFIFAYPLSDSDHCYTDWDFDYIGVADFNTDEILYQTKKNKPSRFKVFERLQSIFLGNLSE